MKKLAGVLLLSTLFLAGCASQSTPANQTKTTSEKKAPNTTIKGTISKTDGKFYSSSAGRVPTELDSYTVKLDQYVGKDVSVTGQFSGTTLFVDSVTE